MGPGHGVFQIQQIMTKNAEFLHFFLSLLTTSGKGERYSPRVAIVRNSTPPVLWYFQEHFIVKGFLGILVGLIWSSV